MTPLILGGRKFLASNPFFPIFSATDAPRGGLHLLLGHHQQWAPPTKTVSKPYLKCTDTSHFTLQKLTGIFCYFCCLRTALHAKLYSGNCWGNEYRATHLCLPHSHQIVAHRQLINQCSFPLEYNWTRIWSYEKFHTA
jgi:hypothetical protein